MIVDKVRLKELAEAATPGEWAKHEGRLGGVVYGGPVQHWVRGSGQSQIAMTTGAEWMRPGENESNAAFIAAANPAAVLALLAEIERLTAGIHGYDSPEHAAQVADTHGHNLVLAEKRLNSVAALCSTVEQERDQLKAKLAELEATAEPAAWANDQQLLLCSKSPREVQPNNPMMHDLPRNIAGSALKTDYCNTPLYTSPPDTGAWRPLELAGQIQQGDWLSFTVAGSFFCAQAKLIIYPGTDKEEIVYNRQKNHYFVTSMAVDGTSTHKGVLVARQKNG